ncbi:hypothetical protein L7F22_049108 [Adiantum nelumboides]|nr:hypothetical protein [Adiantum nelumboides]
MTWLLFKDEMEQKIEELGKGMDEICRAKVIKKMEITYRGKTSKYARIADPTNEEKFWIVEEKRRRENGEEGPSKRAIRSAGRRDLGTSQEPSSQVPPPPEVLMEETSTGKKKDTGKAKGKSPTYKLQSDIEATTNLKKVLEEKILNSKVEFTLGEVLGIAKREFHEEIIDIIKRKRQTLTESIHS